MKASICRRSFFVGRPVPRARSTKPLIRLISRISYCFWVGDVLIDFGNQLGSYAALDRFENLEGVGDGRFAHIDYLARFDAAGGFHVDATHRHASVLACVSSYRAGLEYASRPQPFVYPRCVTHFFPSLLYWFMVMSIPARTKLLIISTAVSMAGWSCFMSSSEYRPSTQSICAPRGKSLPIPMRRRA